MDKKTEEEQKVPEFDREAYEEMLIKKFEHDIVNRPRWFRFLLTVDQMFNVLIWNGSQDETISSNIGRRIRDGKANKADKLICCFLRKIESKHCKKSIGE